MTTGTLTSNDPDGSFDVGGGLNKMIAIGVVIFYARIYVPFQLRISHIFFGWKGPVFMFTLFVMLLWTLVESLCKEEQ